MGQLSYKVLVIDDQMLPIFELIKRIEKNPNLKFMGYETNPKQAVGRIISGELRPDIVLLDIEMPEMTGFEVAKQIAKFTHIVFVTGHEEHALNAFDFEIEDFIVKNTSEERFNVSIEKSISMIELKKLAAKAKQESQILFKIDGQSEWFSTNDIEYFEGLDYLCKIVLSEKAIKTVGMNMKEMDEYAAGYGFMRVHKSFIVNLGKVASYSRYSLVLQSGIKLPLGRRYKADFKAWMETQK